MNNDFIFGIGLMSGTSLDGLDIVYVRFSKRYPNRFKILNAQTISYSNLWLQRFNDAFKLEKDHIAILHRDYGRFLGNETRRFIKKNSITNLHFIASHGHTIFHQPDKGITLQVGDGQEISNETNHKVISDFRTQDVLLGGQGAPLVPIGDQLLFSSYDACINLGGFANISYQRNNKRIAFDICPVNIVMNYYSRKIGFEFDDKGSLSAKGYIDEILLNQLNCLDFYKAMPPKSLGLEWVNEFIIPLIDQYQLDPYTILRTFSEHIAQQISFIIEPFENVLFTGGGVYNDFLIRRIEEISNTTIILPPNEIINFKEALIFALLGLLKIEGKVNCLSSVTGASKNHSSGLIFTPNNSE